MEYFIYNLEKSLTLDAPLVSLIGAFTLIDAVSAIDSKNGWAKQSKFNAWFGKYLPTYLRMVSVEVFYQFRCIILHQMYGEINKNFPIRLLFFPRGSQIRGHYNLFSSGEETALHLDINTFVNDVAAAARKCLEESIHYKTHKEKIITLHPKGVIPFVDGLPVITSGKSIATKE